MRKRSQDGTLWSPSPVVAKSVLETPGWRRVSIKAELSYLLLSLRQLWEHRASSHECHQMAHLPSSQKKTRYGWASPHPNLLRHFYILRKSSEDSWWVTLGSPYLGQAFKSLGSWIQGKNSSLEPTGSLKAAMQPPRALPRLLVSSSPGHTHTKAALADDYAYQEHYHHVW